MKFDSILDAVGRTPLVRLHRMTRGYKAEVYGKLEYLNPGGSMKDRVAIRMVNAAEKEGRLKPGGTIIEGTSGNTGMGLAQLAAVRGYKVIFTITDKQSREKINALKALGAEVIVCPTAVAPDDPRSYYQVAKKLAREIPNSFYPNQYDNPNNPMAHYETTAPEIWQDTEGKITHFVAGMGTGGTITGIGRYLKEKNPKVKIVGVDPVGSLYYDYFHTGRVIQAHPYKVEGIGEDIFPSTMDFSVIDDVLQVSDKDCFLLARRLAKEEGIFSGGSTGAALFGALKVAEKAKAGDVVVFFAPDGGMRALNKVYNEEWMRENQFLEPELAINAGDIVRFKRAKAAIGKLVTARPQDTVHGALEIMQRHDISQLPIFEEGAPIGAIYEDDVLKLVLQGKDLKALVVREVMGPPFPVVEPPAPVDELMAHVTARAPAVFVKLADGDYEIVTKYDIIHAVAERT